MGLHPVIRCYHFRGKGHIGWLVEIVFGGTHKFHELSLLFLVKLKKMAAITLKTKVE